MNAKPKIDTEAVRETWECEDCGWTCSPNPAIPLEEAECDNCGGELVSAADSER